MLAAEWVMYKRVDPRRPDLVEYYTASVNAFHGDEDDGYTREVLFRGTRDEAGKMWKFVIDVNEEEA